MNIDFLIDRYYAINYEYPLSFEDLISFCRVDSSYFLSISIQDAFLLDYPIFEKATKKINWIINDTLFPKQELIVLYKKDTLTHRINELRFPCIGFYNDAYVNCYLKEPESLDVFLSFCNHCDSLEDGTNALYDKCNSVTVKNLQKSKQIESLQWINTDDELFIVIENDTVWRHSNELLPCIDYLKPIFQPHYYDMMDRYVKLEENVDKEFKNNLRELWYPYVNQSNMKERDYLTLVYSNTEGFYSFCEDNEIDTKNKYFKDMGKYLKKFIDKHGLNKVVFAAPAVGKLE